MDANIKSNPPHPQMESPNMLKKNNNNKKKKQRKQSQWNKKDISFCWGLKEEDGSALVPTSLKGW